MNLLRESRLLCAVRDLCLRLCSIAALVAPLLLRIALALPFLRSGLTRGTASCLCRKGSSFFSKNSSSYISW